MFAAPGWLAGVVAGSRSMRRVRSCATFMAICSWCVEVLDGVRYGARDRSDDRRPLAAGAYGTVSQVGCIMPPVAGTRVCHVSRQDVGKRGKTRSGFSRSGKIHAVTQCGLRSANSEGR